MTAWILAGRVGPPPWVGLSLAGGPGLGGELAC